MSDGEITAAKARALLKGTTPGPWRDSRSHDDAHGWLYLVSSDRYEVARVIDGQGSEEIHDVKLLAAAPALAEAVIAQSDTIVDRDAAIERLTRERDDAIAESYRVADLCLSAQAEAMRANADARNAYIGWRAECEHRARLMRELAEARAIGGGRAMAPTDEEIDAHAAAGGVWLVRAEWRVGRQSLDFVQSWAPQIARMLRDHNNATWWLALDATHMPSAWPVAAGAR